MAEKKETVTYFSLQKDIEAGKFQPIYLLHGEEPYYIDRLSDLIVDKALSEDERDFNLSVYYGSEANVRDVIASCKEYPAFSQYKVVVLREAQNVSKQSGGRGKDLELFKLYAENPLRSTILVICHKGGAMSAKAFIDTMKKVQTGVVFSSPKVSDFGLQPLITNYCASIGCNIDAKSAALLAESIGNDLSRLFGEIDKLKILVGENRMITPELIERNIGISKDYNSFELQDALSSRNAEKAYRILAYFERNSKEHPVQPVIVSLFNYFTSVLLVHSSKDKSAAHLMQVVGTKSQYRLNKIIDTGRRYSKMACVNIIGYLRECDVKSKGMGSRQDPYDLLNELIFKILHS